MTAVLYQGHFTVTYPDHLDLATGKTLVAVPGQSYVTAVAPGRNAGLPALPGDGRWGTSGAAAPAPRSPRTRKPPAVPAAAAPPTIPAAPVAPASGESED